MGTQAEAFYKDCTIVPVSQINTARFIASVPEKYRANIEEAWIYKDGKMRFIMVFRDKSRAQLNWFPPSKMILIPVVNVSLL